MRWFGKDAIAAAIDERAARDAIEMAFRQHSSQAIQSIAVGHLRFDRPPGDFHVKGAHLAGRSTFAIKMASSFYDNPAVGLPSSNGLMLVFDTKTGRPLGALLDEGLLTDVRTAIAGGIAARLIAPANTHTVGIVGTGTQAALQARWVSRLLGVNAVLIWGRNPERAEELAGKLRETGLAATVARTVEDLSARSDVVVTTTPSSTPVIGATCLRAGLRVVAVGADAAGKREIAPEIMAATDIVLADSRAQCLAYGDCAGVGVDDRIVEIGNALNEPFPPLADTAVAVADLTGIGAQDAAIAEVVWHSLSGRAALQAG